MGGKSDKAKWWWRRISLRGLIMLVTILGPAVGCKVEVGVGGIGGNIDPHDPDVEYFQDDESKRQLEEQAERMSQVKTK